MTLFATKSCPPKPRETHLSYLSRLAACKGSNSHDFAFDMGSRLRAVIYQTPDALSQLQLYGQLDLLELKELLSWSGSPAGEAQVRFRGELLPAKSIRNSIMRGCTSCLWEDFEGFDDPFEHLAIRGDWQFRDTQICLIHAKPLVALWKNSHITERYDYGQNFRGILNELSSGSLEPAEVEPTHYDQWLDKRIATGVDETFLADKPLYAATSFCRLLGNELAPGKIHQIHQIGFNFASQGEDAIFEAFDQLAVRARSALDEPKKTFGKLYSNLDEISRSNAENNPFCNILRRYILRNWQIPAGKPVLGHKLPERQIHSVTSFAQTCGIQTRLAKRFLNYLEIVDANNTLPDNRTIFPVKQVKAISAIIPNLVGLKAMCQAMNANRTELFALRDSHILKLRFPELEINKPWLISDGLELIKDLKAHAVPVSNGASDWETLHSAHFRKKLPLNLIIEAVRNGILPLGCRDGVAGYRSLCVRRADLDDVAAELAQGSTSPFPQGGTTLSAFGRSIGVRDTKILRRLFEHGHSPASIPPCPAQNRMTPSLTKDDITLFHSKYATLTTISKRTGKHRNTLRSRFTHVSLKPFRYDGESFPGIYLWSEVQLLLPEAAEIRK